MKIQTLKDIKKALKDIPDETLDEFGVGYNEEGNMEVGLLYFGTDLINNDEMNYSSISKKYPNISLVDNWIRKIAEMGVKSDKCETNDMEPQEEAMSVEN